MLYTLSRQVKRAMRRERMKDHRRQQVKLFGIRGYKRRVYMAKHRGYSLKHPNSRGMSIFSY